MNSFIEIAFTTLADQSEYAELRRLEILGCPKKCPDNKKQIVERPKICLGRLKHLQAPNKCLGHQKNIFDAQQNFWTYSSQPCHLNPVFVNMRSSAGVVPTAVEPKSRRFQLFTFNLPN